MEGLGIEAIATWRWRVYPSTTWLNKPYPYLGRLNDDKKKFNKTLSSACVTLERTFGVLVAEKGATWCSFKPNVNLENVHPENFCYIFSKKNFPMF